MRKYTTFILLWIWAIAPCVFAESAAPETVVQEFVSAWNAHDMKKLESLFTQDATWVTTYDMRLQGRARVIADFAEAHEGWAKSTTVAGASVFVQRLGREVAAVHFNLALSQIGSQLPPIGRTVLAVVVQQGDNWKIVAGQVTKPNCPPPAK